MKFEKLLVNDKILPLCQRNVSPYKHYNKNELWKTVRPTSFQKAQLQSVSIFLKLASNLSIRAFLCICSVIYTFFSRFESLNLSFTQFGGSFLRLNFDNFFRKRQVPFQLEKLISPGRLFNFQILCSAVLGSWVQTTAHSCCNVIVRTTHYYTWRTSGLNSRPNVFQPVHERSTRRHQV